MKHTILAVSMLAATALVAQAATAQGPADKPVAHTFAIDLDANGQVTGMAPTDAMPVALREQLESSINDWIFTPARADDQAGATRTYLRITTAAEPGPTGMPRILSATTGPGVAHLSNPVYPVSELRRGEGGIVVLELQIDASGQVTEVGFYGDKQRASRSLANAAKAAAHDWQFNPETINGAPVASTVVMPVCFMADNPTPSACSWQGPNSQQYNRVDIVAVNPAVRVDTGVGQFASN